MKNSKKRIIRSLIESYRAKYPFLDEAEYKSLALKKYNEVSGFNALQQRMDNAKNAYNQYILSKGYGFMNPQTALARALADREFLAILKANRLTPTDLKNSSKS